MAGEGDAYDGEAINPKHLSLIERLLGVGERLLQSAPLLLLLRSVRCALCACQLQWVHGGPAQMWVSGCPPPS